MSIVTRAFLRYLPRRKGLSLLQVIGIALGAAATVGMVLSARTALYSFQRAVEFLKGDATHSLERPAGPMPEKDLWTLAFDGAVEAFSPVIDRRLSLSTGEVVRVMGIDPFLDRKVRPEFYQQGKISGWEEEEFLSFLLQERTVLVDSSTYARMMLGKGHSLETSHGDLWVLGSFPNRSGEPLMLMDISHAQSLFALEGRIDRVDLILRDELDFLSRWSQGYVVRSVQEQSSSLTEMLSAFRLNLEALSLLALFVGVFLVYNTAMFAVVSRKRDAGILLSLGATRAEILKAFLSELLILGGLGGALGSLLGYVLSLTLTQVVSRTISQLYFFLWPERPDWSYQLLFYGVLLGVGASLLGAVVPLVDLLKTDPIKAMRGRALSHPRGTTIRKLALGGVTCLALSGAIVLFSGGVYWGFASAFGTLLGASLMVGWVMRRLGSPLKAILGLAAGCGGRLAASNVSQNLGRTAVAVAAFMVALSMSIGLGSMIGSFRQTLIWWMDSQLRGDLYIAPSREIEVPELLLQELQAIPGIGGLDPYRNTQTLYMGRWVQISAVDASTLKKFTRFGWLKGGQEHWDRVLQGDVIVSESFARRFQVSEGEYLTLEGARGPVRLRIEAVFYDYTTEHGLIMMDRKTYLEIFDDPTIDALVVFIEAQGLPREQVMEKVKSLAWKYGLPVSEQREFHGNILSLFDATFAVTRSMRAMAVVVAFFGIAGAILTLFIERQRDFGIYRALGFSSGQVAGITVLEGLAMGVWSFVLSVFAGTALAWVLIRAINLRSFHWTIFFHWGWEPYVLSLATALIASLGAALYPTWRVYRTYPLMQIRDE